VAAPATTAVAYDPGCYLCPGNARVSGAANARYASTFVFDNDHPCVGADAPREVAVPTPFYRAAPAVGAARVVCFSPRHDLTLAEMPPAAIAGVVDVWRAQTRELGARPEVRQVLCFENKGEIVGVSNPHPHGQIYATSFVWKTFEIEEAASARHLRDTGRGLMADIIRAEQLDGRRVLHEDEHVIAFVPYFARYAYEVYVVPKRRVAHVFDAGRREVGGARARAVRRHRPLRQPVAHVVSLRAGPAPGATHGRRRRRARSTSSSRSTRRCASRICSSTWRVPRSAAATSCPTPRRRRRRRS
jgi:UDPglucose--hexose-1-phosphate uridylyltransferase